MRDKAAIPCVPTVGHIKARKEVDCLELTLAKRLC